MEKPLKIVISGGTGKLGSYLCKLEPSIIAPTRKEMDILDGGMIERCFKKYKPDVFIHCAALTGPIQCDNDPIKAMEVNMEGTCNITKACSQNGTRLVYISTDYVFKGDKGYYSEDDELFPQNLYAWSKLGGECAVRMYLKSLIIRTSFSPDVFPYDKAFVDQYTSRDSLAVIAPIILKLAKRDEMVGIINVGTERKSVKDLAIKLGKTNVADIFRKEVPFNAPYDTSFNLKKLKEIFKQK